MAHIEGADVLGSPYSRIINEVESYANEVIKQMVTGPGCLAQSNYYIPWYHIEIGDKNSAYYWEIISSGSETQNPIVQIEHRKNGSGLSNSFTIVLAWKLTSPTNIIDKILAKAGLDARGSKFGLEYGYGPPHNIISPKYNGIITSYSIEARNGLLTYTLIGYSSIVNANSEVISLNLTKSEDGTAINRKPTEVVRDLVKSYSNMPAHNNKNNFAYFDYELIADKDVIGSDRDLDISSQIELLTTPQMTLFQWIDWLLSIAVYKNDTEDTPSEDKSVYTYIVIDKKLTSTDKNLILLRRYSTKEILSNISIEFEWGTTTEGKFNLVHDFRPQYNGEVAIAMVSNSQNSSNYPVYTIDESGNVELSTISSERPSSNPIENEATDVSTWNRMIEENLYKAQLVTAGIPADIPILTTLNITPFIGGVRHDLTAGDYWVLSTVDRISSSGFITTMELFKNNRNKYDYTRPTRGNPFTTATPMIN